VHDRGGDGPYTGAATVGNNQVRSLAGRPWCSLALTRWWLPVTEGRGYPLPPACRRERPRTSSAASWSRAAGGRARTPRPREPAVKRTFQPNRRRRAKKHGFRARMRTRGGRRVINDRRRRGRAKLSA